MQDKEYPSDGAFQVSLHVQRDDDRKESEPKRLLAMIDAATIGALSGISFLEQCCSFWSSV